MDDIRTVVGRREKRIPNKNDVSLSVKYGEQVIETVQPGSFPDRDRNGR
jgi:hypothetical protein